MTITTTLDARNQYVLRRLRLTGLITAIAGRYLRFVRSVRKIRACKERFRKPHGLDMPRQLGVSLEPRDRVAVGTGATLYQILGNPEGLYARLGGRAIAFGTRHRLSGSTHALLRRIRVATEQPRAVVLDERLQHSLRIAMRHAARRVIRIETQRVAVAAMLIHRYWLHAGTTWFGQVAFTAFDNAATIRRDDTRFIEMHSMIEFQVRLIGTLCLVQQHALDIPLSLAILGDSRQQQAHLEFRVCVEEISGGLERNITGQALMTVGAQVLVSIDKIRRFVVLQVTACTTDFAEHF